jgi:hypothetical protein
LEGERAHATVEVQVPTTPSPRPDGKHFFYAIVYAGKPEFPARAWTGPLLTMPGSGDEQDGGGEPRGGGSDGRGSPDSGPTESQAPRERSSSHGIRTAYAATFAPFAAAAPRSSCGCRA